MSKWYPIQSSFNAGEISPVFLSRQDLPLYKEGLARCRNMLPLSQGVLHSRPGLRYLSEVEGFGLGVPTNARCFPIELDAKTWILALMGGGGVTVISGGEFYSDAQLVVNPEMNQGRNGYNITLGGGRNIVTPAFREAENEWALRIFAKQDKPQVDPNPKGTVTIGQTIVIPSPGTGDFIFETQLTWGSNAQNSSSNIRLRLGSTPGGGEYIDQTYLRAPGERVTISQKLPGTAGTTDPVYVELYATGDYGLDVLIDWDYCRLYSPGTLVPSAAPLAIPYADEDLDAIQFVASPYEESVLFVHPDYPPQQLILVGVDWVFQPVPFTGGGGTAPDWSVSAGYPTAVGTFQGRVYFGATYAEPQTVWASEPGDWYNLNLPVDPDATSPIAFTLQARGTIRWIDGQKGLLVGTSNAEHELNDAVPDSVIQAGNISVNRQSAYGSAAIQPDDVGENVFYIANDGKTVRSTNYSDNQKGWKSDNISWQAPHITRPRIRRMAYARDPFRTMWMPLTNGDLAGLSYEPTFSMIGWSRHNTEGSFVDTCSARIDGLDYTFFLVNREINGESKFYLEAILEVVGGDNEQLVAFMDSFVEKPLGGDNVVTGLEHLEGKLVQVVADGARHPDRVVVGGQILLDYDAGKVLVGLPYRCSITTLPPPSPENVGGLGAKRGWSELGVRLYTSSLPIINGQRAPDRTPATPMNTPEPVFTGDVIQTVTGWDEGGRVTVEQDLPTPLIITGIFGRLSVEEL